MISMRSVVQIVFVLCAVMLLGCSAPPYDYCQSGTKPDLACYRQKRKPDSANIALAKRIADRQIKRQSADEVKWNWEEAVMMSGFMELHKLTGDAKYQKYYQDWMNHHIKLGYRIYSSDSCAPAMIAVDLLKNTKDAKYQKVLDDALHFLNKEAARTKEGGINHLGKVTDFGITLWLDSLYMFGEIFIRLGETKDDAKFLDEYKKQYLIFAKLLQQKDGWFVHAHQWAAEVDKDIYWARGNSWVTASAFDYLRVRKIRGEEDAEVLTSIKKQADAIVAAQDKESGLWWNLVNRPGKIYKETSGSALFVYGLARGYRYGFLDASVLPIIHKGIAGVQKQIKDNAKGEPVIHGISGPTNAGTYDIYARVKLEEDLPFGVGAVLLALIETSGLPKDTNQ